MENNNNEKIEYVTSKELDKKFEEHAQIIISAVGSIVTKRLIESESRLDKRLDAVELRLEEKIDAVETVLGEKIDKLQTHMDGFVKKQSDFEDEHVIIKEEVKQMKRAFKDKLGVEIQAI